MKTTKRLIAVVCVLLICATLVSSVASAAYNPYPTLKYGSSGNEVKMLQTMLNRVNKAGLSVDGIYGSATRTAVRAFQKKIGLTVDGITGYNTWTALIARYKSAIMLSNGSTGNDVRMLQRMLNYVVGSKLDVDGIFGNATRTAVIKFQKGVFSDPKEWDGIVGPKTWQRLFAHYFDNYWMDHN